ncbi:MAG: response regulator transcription factor [Hyphomicrobiaceae bacterium]|nr:response regulator transcription factor [Hyphomicrobiaceae bacterium]
MPTHAPHHADPPSAALRLDQLLIADDHDVYRTGLGMILRDCGQVGHVLEAANFDDALDRLAAGTVDLAVFDLEMPGMNGSATLREVRATYPDLTLVVVSACTDAVVIAEATDAGVDAYITKITGLPEMIDTIRRAHARRRGLDRQALGPRTSTARGILPAKRRPRSTGLTPRQQDVLDLVVQGLSNKEVADRLGIAHGTVKIHLAALLSYFKARNRTELVGKSRALAGRATT